MKPSDVCLAKRKLAAPKTKRFQSIFKPALLYFLIVFGAGFILEPIRVFLIVPRLGIRWAELLEMPFMLTVIYFASGKIERRFSMGATDRLRYALIVLGLALAAELAVAVFVHGRSIRDAFLDRDPVSGSADYVNSLLPLRQCVSVDNRLLPVTMCSSSSSAT